MTLGATPTALGAIQTAAKARGLAWQPLAAVAHFESGLNPQSIGDGGHAFGLFQNNNAGGTITGDPNPRRFLNPTVSANYTADAIKRLGIQGLAPAQQVAAIVSRYERPANPGREIAGAQQYLQTLGTQPQSTQGASVSVPGALATPQAQFPAASLAPLQAGLGLQQQTNQRALDALGKLSGRSVQAAEAPNLAALTSSQTPQLQPTARTQIVSVNPAHPAPKGLDTQQQKIVELAKHYLGQKYVFGGEKPGAWDCSGLAQWTYAHNGIKIPRTAAEQYQAAKKIGAGQLKPGDLVFFSNTDGPGVTHVGIYAGGPNRTFIQAPHTGDVVKVSSLNDPYYQAHFTAGGTFT